MFLPNTAMRPAGCCLRRETHQDVREVHDVNEEERKGLSCRKGRVGIVYRDCKLVQMNCPRNYNVHPYVGNLSFPNKTPDTA